MTAMLRQPDDDRVLDWHDELRRIEGRFSELPASARLAVLRLVQLFRDEDGQAAQNRAA
jgi:hypothetical protein